MACAVATALFGAAARGQDQPVLTVSRTEQFGDFSVQLDSLESPAGVDVDRSGNIYIAEAGLDRISVFDRTGKSLRTIGTSGFGEGQLQRPGDVAVAADGVIYVADTGNHRIVVFDAEGKPLRAWGRRATGPGAFCEPTGVAVTDDRVYVVDTGNRRVQVFSLDGEFVREIRTRDKGEPKLARPVDVAVDAAGNAYVLDADLSKVLVFDGAGRATGQWGDWGWQAGLLADPGGIAIRGGQVYVADSRNQRIQVYANDGTVRYDWGKHAVHPHEGNGKIHYPGDVAIAPDDSFAVVTEPFENRAQVFVKRTSESRDDAVRSEWWERSTGAHFGRRAVSAGTLFAVTEPDTHSVLVYDLRSEDPVRINRFGGLGSGFGQFLRPTGVELDFAARRLYVTDSARRRVQVFALDYDPSAPLAMQPKLTRFVTAVDLDELAKTIPSENHLWPIEPTAIKRSFDGALYLLDARNARVFVLSPELSFVRAWGAFGHQKGQWLQPTDLAIARDGREIYVTDAQRNCITVHRPDGELLKELPANPDRSKPSHLFGIAMLPGGGFVTTDTGTNTLREMSEHGAVTKTCGGRGLGRRQLYKPAGVTVDEKGRIIVIDYGNHRAQILSPELDYIEAFGSRFFTEAARNAARRDERANRKPQPDAE